MEDILVAAIWFPDEPTPIHNCTNIENGVVLCGFRHGHIIHQYFSITGKRVPTVKSIQGFITTKNRFVDRIEAHKIFIENGHTPEFNDELYSEDLY